MWWMSSVTLSAQPENGVNADGVMIMDSDFHSLEPSQRRRSSGPCLPVIVKNNAWIGSRALILKGVSIGTNSVVGAMSVVTRNVPDNCVVAGNPARLVKSL